MEVAVRKQELSLANQLDKNPQSFSFEMAAAILEYGSPVSFGKESNISIAPFKTFSINSFYLRATEIEKIIKETDKKIIYVERLALTGWSGPMPTPYSEFIFRRSMLRDKAISNFLNSFNSRLLGISYQISRRRFLNLQKFEKNEDNMLIRSIATFFGAHPMHMARNFARLSYLFWTKEKNAAGLEAIITSLFQFETHVEEFVHTWNEFNEKSILNSKVLLGKNSMLGKTASSVAYGIRINLVIDKFETIEKLFSDPIYVNGLRYIIDKYLGKFIDYIITVTPKNTPAIKLNGSRMGLTSWLICKDDREKVKYQRAVI